MNKAVQEIVDAFMHSPEFYRQPSLNLVRIHTKSLLDKKDATFYDYSSAYSDMPVAEVFFADSYRHAVRDLMALRISEEEYDSALDIIKKNSAQVREELEKIAREERGIIEAAAIDYCVSQCKDSFSEAFSALSDSKKRDVYDKVWKRANAIEGGKSLEFVMRRFIDLLELVDDVIGDVSSETKNG